MNETERVALLPCPNPWCTSTTPPLPVKATYADDAWRVRCACGVVSFRSDTEAKAMAAWNTRPAIAAMGWRDITEVRKVLAPFAEVADNDIGENETDSDTFRPMSPRYNKAPLITVGDLRRASAFFASLPTPPESAS